MGHQVTHGGSLRLPSIGSQVTHGIAPQLYKQAVSEII
jgi:hypothetical protein